MDYGGSGLFLLLGTKRNNLKQRKENMERMKKKKMVAIAFSFLLITFPLQVFAAGSDLTKEITLTVKNEADSRELAEKEFPETWKEGGKTYERSEITYKLVETKYLDKKEKEMELKSEPEQTFTEGKTVYTLKKTEKVEKSIAEGDVQTVTAYDDYDYAIAESDVPATKTVTETNRITGEPEEVICNLTGIHPAGTVMANNTMTVTFTNYDAAYYEWNGNYIPRNDKTPPLAGYEAQLLENVGAAAGSVITGYNWHGDSYFVNNVLCRDAIANVQQPVQMYRAEYSGVIQIPKETVYKAVYVTDDVDGSKEYIVTATAAYSLQSNNTPYILAGTGIFLLLVLIVMIIFVISKKKKKKGATNSTH